MKSLEVPATNTPACDDKSNAVVPIRVAAAYKAAEDDLQKERLWQVDDLERALDFIQSQERSAAAKAAASSLTADPVRPEAPAAPAQTAASAAAQPPHSSRLPVGPAPSVPPSAGQAAPPRPGSFAAMSAPPATAAAAPGQGPATPEPKQKAKNSVIIFRPDMPEPHELRTSDGGALASMMGCCYVDMVNSFYSSDTLKARQR